MTERKLSERQKDILDFIASYTQENMCPPTVREIGTAVGLSSPSSVQTQLTRLAEMGYIKRRSAKSRSMVITEKGTADAGTASSAATSTEAERTTSVLPLVGRVAAGTPILAEENIEEEVPVPVSFFGDANSFLLTVHGESMIGAGIFDGDVLIVRKQETADNGDIVVALIGDEATVKTYYLEKDCIRLQPQNEAMEPILTRDAKVVGVVTGLFRRM